jgi:hypothetical protein
MICRAILTLCAVSLFACGGGGNKSGTGPATAAVGGYSATRWVPGNVTFLLTSRTNREAQQGVRDLIETFGPLVDVGIEEISREITRLLLVDTLSPEAVAGIGVDLEGGFAMFSEGYNPTVVTKLASPAAFRAFIERQQDLKMQSVVEGGIEVFSAPLTGKVRVSWAIADDWLWIHLLLPDVPDDSATWFAASRKPSAPTWTAELQAANAPVAGFIDAARLLTEAAGHSTGSLKACLQSLSIGRTTFALGGDPKQVNARIAIDVGAAAPELAKLVDPIPDGFATATAQVPLAVQMNVKLSGLRAKYNACFQVLEIGDELAELGIDSGRGYLRTFDPDDKSGSGAVSLDLTHPKFLQDQISRIPMRSAFERSRTIAGMPGKALSIPTFPTVEYILTPSLALAGIGDGQLSTMIGKGGRVPGPVLDIAVQPQGLSTESWSELFELLDIDNAKRVAERLQRWRQLRVNLTIEGSRLVLVATGTRR